MDDLNQEKLIIKGINKHRCRDCGEEYIGFDNPNDIYCQECTTKRVVRELRIIGILSLIAFVIGLLSLIIILWCLK